VARHLLVVHHSRSGSTRLLCDDALAGAVDAGGAEVDIRSLGAFDAGPDDVGWAEAILLLTPANFGYMSGALKDFFERIYHACLGLTVGLPYALVVKATTDADGAVASVERIVAGLKWRLLQPPLVVVGALGPDHRAAARELGATLAASLEAGII
jgi:multimeric flavodoxin WrbA